MSTYLKLYWLFKSLALIAAIAVVYALFQIGPWAMWGLVAGLGFKCLDWLGEEAFRDYRKEKALLSHFAASQGSAKENT